MKLNVLTLAAAGLLLAACGGKGEKAAHTLADYENASMADSLMYYFGQMRAVDYWHEAESDTILKSRDSRDEFLRGVRAGMDATRQSDAYNQGLFVGVQLAMNLKEMQAAYGMTPNRQILLDGITDGLVNDSVVNPGEANIGFQQIVERLNIQKEETDRQKGQDALVKEAKTMKMTRLSDNLYAGAAGNAAGETLHVGDRVAVQLTVKVVGGETLDERAHHEFEIGAALPGPITEALLSMHVGETRRFLTTPPALFGRYYERRGLKPEDVLEVIITTDKVSEAAILPADSVAPATRRPNYR